ncbi:hypothetical protein ACFPRL_28930 [Pseudoclavibacter helvolus]
MGCNPSRGENPIPSRAWWARALAPRRPGAPCRGASGQAQSPTYPGARRRGRSCGRASRWLSLPATGG